MKANERQNNDNILRLKESFACLATPATQEAIDDNSTTSEKTLKKRFVINDDDRKLINAISQVIKPHATNCHEKFDRRNSSKMETSTQ